MMKWALSAVSPAGSQAALSILIFHRVLKERDQLFPDEVTAAEFENICQWLSQWFNVLPLEEAVESLKRGSLPARAASITFDDGYADNHDVAAPILQRHGLPATFFIAAGFLDGGCMWNDKVAEAVRQAASPELVLLNPAVPDLQRIPVATMAEKKAAVRRLIGGIKYLLPELRDEVVDELIAGSGAETPRHLMMSSDQVRALEQFNVTVGAHTMTHPILARLGDVQARQEMADGRDVLSALIKRPVSMFAYPNGRPVEDYGRRDVRLAESLGFKAAVSTVWGASTACSDLFQLPRFTPWDRSSYRFGLRMLNNITSRSNNALI